MALNSQHKRVSKNRVSVTYDVETNGAVETKELPFVVGVIGDYSGHRQDKQEVDERTFYNVDKDNFDGDKSFKSSVKPTKNMMVMANKILKLVSLIL